MKKIIILLIIAIAGFIAWRRWSQKSVVPTEAYRELTVTRSQIRQEILATAIAKPQNRLEINSPVAGRIDEILVREGDPVTNGQLLGWVSSTDRATLLDAARTRGGDEAARWANMYKPAPLIAPLAATVIDRKMEPGQSVSPSDAILVLSDRLIIEASVDETDIRNIRTGQIVRVEFDAYRGQAFSARVDQIAYDADTKSGVTLYAVDVLCEATPAFLRSGMSANMNFLVSETNNVLVIPVAALQSGDSGPQVLRPATPPGTDPVRSTVRTGLDDGRHVEVREGLREGDIILIQPGIKAAATNQVSNPLIPMPRGGRPRR